MQEFLLVSVKKLENTEKIHGGFLEFINLRKLNSLLLLTVRTYVRISFIIFIYIGAVIFLIMIVIIITIIIAIIIIDIIIIIMIITIIIITIIIIPYLRTLF